MRRECISTSENWLDQKRNVMGTRGKRRTHLATWTNWIKLTVSGTLPNLFDSVIISNPGVGRRAHEHEVSDDAVISDIDRRTCEHQDKSSSLGESNRKYTENTPSDSKINPPLPESPPLVGCFSTSWLRGNGHDLTLWTLVDSELSILFNQYTDKLSRPEVNAEAINSYNWISTEKTGSPKQILKCCI